MTSQYPRGRRGFRRGDGERPLVLGHRGARHAAPENTLAAFDLAIEEGADGVELDVRLAHDDEVVVMHDVSLARVTGGLDERPVDALDSFELAQIDVGGGEHPPTLRQVLDWARSRRTRLNVELKHDGSRTEGLAARVVELVRACAPLEGRVLLSCFHPGLVRKLARLAPDIPVAWLVHRRQRAFREGRGWKALGAAGINPEHALVTPGRMARWRDEGALINVWTVNEPDDALRLASLGVDTLISDTPGRILAALGVKAGVLR